jgi:hypothetical protein
MSFGLFISFMKRNLWGCLFIIAFIGCLVACFSVPEKFFWWAVVGSFGTFLSGAYCFAYPQFQNHTSVFSGMRIGILEI